jgi:tetratricopeptide (TPR) repeat protein
MQTPHPFQRVARNLALAFLSLAGVAHAQFAPDDEVRLRRDEPLEFKGAKFRQGHRGEIYTVLQYDITLGKVYVLAKDSDGKPFALSVSEQAVEVLPKDVALLMQRGAIALRQKDLAAARENFVKASGGQLAEKSAVDLATLTDALRITMANIAKAHAARDRVAPEIQRMLKNAEVAGRPNPLFPNDPGNQIRAAEIREKAAQLQKQVDQMVMQQETQFIEVVKGLAATTDRLVEAGYLTVAVDVGDGLSALAAQQMPKRPEAQPVFAWNRADIARRSAEAGAAVAMVERELAARRLQAALEALKKGMQAEPGRAELRKLKLRVDGDMDRVKAALLIIESLRQQRDFEKALKEIEQAEALIADSTALETVAREMRQLLNERADAAGKAKAMENAGNYLGALALYDRYGLKVDSTRILSPAARKAEDLGNFILAHSLHARAGSSGDMSRLEKKREEQELIYRGAAVALAEGKYEEAIAIYLRFNDTAARNEALISRGRRVEAEGKYDDARVLYREAEAADELKRLTEWLEKRAKWLNDGAAAELSGDLARAYDLYAKANAKSELQRVSLMLARKYEGAKDFAAAGDYYEQGGDYSRAAAMRARAEKGVGEMLASPEAVLRRCGPACVAVTGSGRGVGSGFFVAKGGYVLTNLHLVEGAPSVLVLTPHGERLPAQIVATGSGTDLALLKVAIAREHAFLPLANSNEVKTGEQVYAIGSQPGLPQSVAEGIVSNVERQIRGNDCFQTSVTTQEQHSGGPLLDGRGRVLGICTAGLGTEGGIGPRAERIHFAIKANEARAVLAKVGM